MNYESILNSIDKVNSYLVIPSEVKNDMILKITELQIKNSNIYQFKVITTNELINLLSFDIDKSILLYNLENYNTPIATTNNLIKFSRYNLENKNEELYSFKKLNKKYISVNNNFINNLNKFKFNILGSSVQLDYYINYYNLDVNIIDIKTDYLPNFIKFNTKENELFYVFEQISILLDNNIDINNISIANTNSTDYTLLNKLSMYYKIPISFNYNHTLYDLPYIKDLLSYDFKDIKKLLDNNELLIEKYRTAYLANRNDFNENINQLISIINKYPYFNYSSEVVKKVIINDLRKTKPRNTITTDAVKLINLDSILCKDLNNHVFIINAYYENFPILQKDNDYLSDIDKELIGYPTTTIINEKTNKYLELLITSPSIKFISFASKDIENEYAASDIFSKYYDKHKTIVDLSINNLTKGFSKKYYQEYFSTHNNVNNSYLKTTFDPSFKIDLLESNTLKEYVATKDLKLTPTDITTYIQSPFVYYLEKIVGISTFEKGITLVIGNYFHLIIEIILVIYFNDLIKEELEGTKIYSRNDELNSDLLDLIESYNHISTENFDFNLFYSKFYNIYFKKELSLVENYDFDNLEKEQVLNIRSLFYLTKHKDAIIDGIKVIISLEDNKSSSELILEKGYETANFRGKADLIKLYNDQSYSIIDYKTGARESFSISKIEVLVDKLLLSTDEEISFDSLNLLQLILYSYILKQALPDYKLDNLAYFSFFEDRLNGITTSTFPSELYVSSKSKFVSKEDLEKLYEKIATILNNTINSIHNLDFKTDMRRDEKTKQTRASSYYSAYEALIFYSEQGGDTLDAEEDD